jgi:hypothetical protein
MRVAKAKLHFDEFVKSREFRLQIGNWLGRKWPGPSNEA